jgi:hypothetical protein
VKERVRQRKNERKRESKMGKHSKNQNEIVDHDNKKQVIR